MSRQVTQAITDSGAQTKAAIGENTAVTREELRRMQLVNELSSLEVRLTSIEGEMRTVQRLPDSKLARLQLQQLQAESTRLRSRIAAIRAVLYPQPKPAPTPAPPKPDSDLKSVFVILLGFIIVSVVLARAMTLFSGSFNSRTTPTPMAVVAVGPATRQPQIGTATAVPTAAKPAHVYPTARPTQTVAPQATTGLARVAVQATSTPTPRPTSAAPIVLPVRLRTANGWEFTVERINLLANIGGEQRHKPTNAAYVALIGTLRNLTFREGCVHGGDFALITNSTTASMESSILDAAKDIYRVDYPGFVLGQCLGSDASASSTLVFDSDPYAYSWLRMDGAEADIGIPFANASMYKPIVTK